MGADDETITSVVTPVSCNLTSMVAVDPALNAIPLCSYSCEPRAPRPLKSIGQAVARAAYTSQRMWLW